MPSAPIVTDATAVIQRLPITGANLTSLISAVLQYAEDSKASADTEAVCELLRDALQASCSVQAWSAMREAA